MWDDFAVATGVLALPLTARQTAVTFPTRPPPRVPIMCYSLYPSTTAVDVDGNQLDVNRLSTPQVF